MNVILLQKVDNLGGLGDQVTVKAGYARNYLLPTGKATEATPENLAKFEARRAEFEKAAADSLAVAQRRADTMNDLSVTVPANAGAEGKLYGSVGVADIAAALARDGVEVRKQEILLAEGPLRQVGEYTVTLRLHSEVERELTVNVVAED